MFNDFSEQDIIDIIHYHSYKQVLEDYKNFEFCTEDSNTFIIRLDPHDLYETNLVVRKNKDLTLSLKRGPIPVTYEQACIKIKAIWTQLYNTLLTNIVDKTIKNINELRFPVENRPKHFVPDDAYQPQYIELLENKKIFKKLIISAKGLRATLTTYGYNTKKATSILAYKYINWLNKDISKYLYGKLGKHASVSAYNLYIQNPTKFKYYNEELTLRNWTITTLLNLKHEEENRFLNKKEFNYSMDIEQLVEYTKNKYPYKKQVVFQQLSPRLIKDTFYKYNLEVERIVDLITTQNINTPTYTICKMLIYYSYYLYLDDTIIALAMNHVTQKSKNMTQIEVWNEFRKHCNTLLSNIY